VEGVRVYVRGACSSIIIKGLIPSQHTLFFFSSIDSPCFARLTFLHSFSSAGPHSFYFLFHFHFRRCFDTPFPRDKEIFTFLPFQLDEIAATTKQQTTTAPLHFLRLVRLKNKKSTLLRKICNSSILCLLSFSLRRRSLSRLP